MRSAMPPGVSENESSQLTVLFPPSKGPVESRRIAVQSCQNGIVSVSLQTGKQGVEYRTGHNYHSYRTQALLKDSVPFEPSEPLQLVDRLLKSSEAEVLLRRAHFVNCQLFCMRA